MVFGLPRRFHRRPAGLIKRGDAGVIACTGVDVEIPDAARITSLVETDAGDGSLEDFGMG